MFIRIARIKDGNQDGQDVYQDFKDGNQDEEDDHKIDQNGRHGQLTDCHIVHAEVFNTVEAFGAFKATCIDTG